MKATLSATVLLLLSGGFSQAGADTGEEIPIRGPIPFTAYDLDGDLIIDEQEFTTVQTERQQQRSMQRIPKSNAPTPPSFVDYDRNGDGGIDADELLAGQKAQMLKRADMLDTGKTPGLGLGHIPLFSEFDQNNDGVVMEHEYTEVQEARISAREQQGFMMRGLGNGKPFAAYDLDGNGEVTPEEFTRAQTPDQRKAAR